MQYNKKGTRPHCIMELSMNELNIYTHNCINVGACGVGKSTDITELLLYSNVEYGVNIKRFNV